MPALALILLLAACAASPVRPAPPVEAWPFCEAYCSRWGEESLGVILPEADGHGFGCGCSITPKPFKQDETYRLPPPWRTPGPRKPRRVFA